jgi:hypothetical protein
MSELVDKMVQWRMISRYIEDCASVSLDLYREDEEVEMVLDFPEEVGKRITSDAKKLYANPEQGRKESVIYV